MGIRPVKNGAAPIRMVGVSASVNLPLHHKVQKFSSGTDSPEWSRKKGRKTVVVVLRLPLNSTRSWMISSVGDRHACSGLIACMCACRSTIPDDYRRRPILLLLLVVVVAGLLVCGVAAV